MLDLVPLARPRREVVASGDHQSRVVGVGAEVPSSIDVGGNRCSLALKTLVDVTLRDGKRVRRVWRPRTPSYPCDGLSLSMSSL
jgi:hypothetical protein